MSDCMSTGWYFTDNSRPEPYRDGGESFPIESEEHLANVLPNYSCQEPRIVVIESPENSYAFVGIGGTLAGISYYVNPGNGVSVTAIPKQPFSNEEKWFVNVGEPFRFRAANLMPVEQVIEIVLHFYRTGTLSGWVDWV